MAKPQEKPTPSTAVQKSAAGDLVVVSNQVPDYIKTQGNRGSENVTSDDLVIPRLEIVQGLSPAVKPTDPGYIKGATVGQLNNSVTRQLYGDSVIVVPVHYSLQYLVWRDRKFGGGNDGGFFGAYPSVQEANDRAQAEGGEGKGVIVIDTPQHLCLLANFDTGTIDEIMISMSRTKAKISRQWNSMIKLAGGDRFGRAYKVSTMHTKNAKGDFYNYHIEPAGFPSRELYAKAEALYAQISKGERRVVMDVSGMSPDEAGSDEEKF